MFSIRTPVGLAFISRRQNITSVFDHPVEDAFLQERLVAELGGRESMSCAWNRIQSSSRRIPRIRFESSWPAPFPPRRMC